MFKKLLSFFRAKRNHRKEQDFLWTLYMEGHEIKVVKNTLIHEQGCWCRRKR